MIPRVRSQAAALTLACMVACAHGPARQTDDGAGSPPEPIAPAPTHETAPADPPVAGSEMAAREEAPVSFDGQILPILQRGCSPCHFAGGSMHARLPFDREATIRELGTRLFTRIKDPAEQALIRRLISQPASEAAPEPRTKPPDTPRESPSPR